MIARLTLCKGLQNQPTWSIANFSSIAHPTTSLLYGQVVIGQRTLRVLVDGWITLERTYWRNQEQAMRLIDAYKVQGPMLLSHHS
jgi:hypothetical protein